MRPHREALTGVILAGGASTRFGSSKAHALLRGRPLLQWVVDALVPACERLLVVGSPGQALPPLHAECTLVTLSDAEPGQGPAGGLAAAFATVGHHGVCAVASCDSPLLRSAIYRVLHDCLAGHDAAVPVVRGMAQTVLALYRPGPSLAACEAALAAGRASLREVLARVDVALVEETHFLEVDPALASFRNANTSADLAAIDAFLGGAAPAPGQ